MYGKTLRAVRRKQGITQRALAGKIGKSKQWVSEFERGHIRLNMDIAVQLAQAVGASPDIFLPHKSNKNGRTGAE